MERRKRRKRRGVGCHCGFGLAAVRSCGYTFEKFICCVVPSFFASRMVKTARKKREHEQTPSQTSPV